MKSSTFVYLEYEEPPEGTDVLAGAAITMIAKVR